MKNSIKIAFCGVISAVITVIMAASIIPNLTFAVPAVARLFIIPVFAEAGAIPAAFCFAVSSGLSFFIGDKTSWLLYLALFGWYPIIKPYVERIKNKILKYLLKILIFNIAAAVCYFSQLLIIGAEIKSWLLVALWVLGNIVFLLYDIAVSRIATLYFARLHKTVYSILSK